jgi:uncharacterized Zn finger protein
MSQPFGLTEAMIHDIADPTVFARGRSYLREGAVTNLARSDDRITAQVHGSDVEPYRVRVKIGPSGIEETHCTCPYAWGGACKHIVAVLLACLERPEALEETPPLAARLSGLGEEELRALLLELAREDDDIALRIERRALARQTKSGPLASSAPPLNPAPYQRQARAVLRSASHGRYDDYPGDANDVVSGLYEVLEPITALLEAGDGRNAMVLLEAVTDEFAGSLDELYDDEGEFSTLIESLDEWWAEALLSADLTAEERNAYLKKLRKWQKRIAASDYDGGLETAEAAAEMGWDYPPLVRVLAGEITDRGAWDGEAAGCADELAVARLNVLERQGRFQEYLFLAEAEGQTERFLTMLVRVGRTTEAVAKGKEWLTEPKQILVLSKALHERGEPEQALQVAEHGLELQPPSGVRGGWVADAEESDLEEEADEDESAEDELDEEVLPFSAPRWSIAVHDSFGWSFQRAELARWLRDTAVSLGQSERALPAARVAMEESPSLADYRALQAIAGEDWPRLRLEVLDRLRAPALNTREAAIDVFLHEGLVDDAIAAVENGHQGHVIVGRVVAAVMKERPEWAMNACFHQADRIIEPGSAQYYSAAAEWLGRAREAAQAGGLMDQWAKRMDDIMTRHQRKYKLMPLLKALR